MVVGPLVDSFAPSLGEVRLICVVTDWGRELGPDNENLASIFN